MKRQSATLRYARPRPPSWEVRLDMPQPPQAGAYVLADFGAPVREPLFPALVDDEGFVTVLAPGHPATRLLPGTPVDVLGPLGRGFRVGDVTRLLLVVEVSYLPLVLPLIRASPSVVLVVEATTRARLPSPVIFPPALELILVTLDGSAGYLGPLDLDGPAPTGLERAAPRLRELLVWAERACFGCTPERYTGLARLVRDVRLQPFQDFAQALVQVPMPCGVGACDVCRVSTRHGEAHACVDGPVFDLMDFLPA